MVQRVDIVDLPIVTYAAISPGKTPERLSWFVDDVGCRTAMESPHPILHVASIL
jgi:hypothetical protein